MRRVAALLGGTVAHRGRHLRQRRLGSARSSKQRWGTEQERETEEDERPKEDDRRRNSSVRTMTSLCEGAASLEDRANRATKTLTALSTS